jgi:cytochrome c
MSAHSFAGACGLALLLAASAPAHAQLALDKGCYSCHGSPPRHNTPTFAEIAADYARFRNQPEAPRQLAQKLRAGGLFSHIAAHERVDQAECEALMRWIIEGAK